MKILISFFILMNFYSCSSGRGNMDYQYENPQPRRISSPVRRRIQEPSNLENTIDREDSGSLWTGQGTDGNLFTNDETQNVGDIVQINVGDKLRAQILQELRRYLMGIEEVKVERMVGTIIQKVNDKHLLIRGRKAIYHGSQTKLIEIQALIAKRDLDHNNVLESDKIFEVTIRVLR